MLELTALNLAGCLVDEHGKIEAECNGEVKETIGHGEKGLRVEVSLKYRRLLVQQLAKDKLLSAKDHEAFRSGLVDRVLAYPC